jgi:Alginate export
MRVLAALVASGLLATHSTGLRAQEPCPNRPAYQNLRYDEDWRLMADPQCVSDAVDRIKFLPFATDSERYLSLGGEARARYEWYRHPNFGAEIEDSNGYWLQRYLLHGDLHLGPSLRVFCQLQSSLVNGRKAGPRPTDKDTLDVNQLFADWTWRGTEADFFTLRGGRQEIQFGSRGWSPRATA